MFTHRDSNNFDLGWQGLTSAVLERLTQVADAGCRQHCNSSSVNSSSLTASSSSSSLVTKEVSHEV